MSHLVKRLVPIDEARGYLGGVGRTTVYGLLDKGLLTKVNIGSRAFITAESLDVFLNQICEAEGSRSEGADVGGGAGS